MKGDDTMTLFGAARAFIYRNARPLALARWRFHFEGGSAQDVLTALSFYQNPDGGFGHALESDCWNPSSSPIQTWNAGCILLEVGAPSEHPLVQGLLRYLDSGADFDAAHQQWLNVIPSNNDFPHALWWQYGEGGSEFRYNPTAMLAGFALLHAPSGSPLHLKARRITDEAIRWFMTGAAQHEQHVVGCFVTLHDCMKRAGLEIPADFDAALHQAVRETVCADAEKFRTEYVCRPSNLIGSADSPFAPDLAEAIQAECDSLEETQEPDGAWAVPWQWWTGYSEFEVAKNWWKSEIILERMQLWAAFGKKE